MNSLEHYQREEPEADYNWDERGRGNLQLAFAFIKPDFVDDLPGIERVMEANDLHVIFAERLVLSPEQVDIIYRSNINDHFYGAMRSYLTSNEVVAMLVGGYCDDVQSALISLKTVDNKDGEIRTRFSKELRISEEDIKLWSNKQHPLQDDLTVILTQKNVIHVPDSSEAAVKEVQAVFGDKLHALKIRGSLPSELLGYTQ